MAHRPESETAEIERAALKALEVEIGRAAVGQTIDTYLEDQPIQLGNLRGAIARGDAPAVRRWAHGLKSPSATLGAKALAQLCQDLETNARLGDLSDADAQAEQIEKRAFRARKELEELRKLF